MKIRHFCKQLSELGCVPTNIKGADQTWRTPRGNALYLKINHMGDDIAVGTLASVMRVLKADGFELNGTKLIAKPEAYPPGWVFPDLKPETQKPSSGGPKKQYKKQWICDLCNQAFEDRNGGTKINKHIEECLKGNKQVCSYCHQTISGSPLGLQKHETYCKSLNR